MKISFHEMKWLRKYLDLGVSVEYEFGVEIELL